MAGRFQTNRPKKTLDTKTGTVYASRNRAGRAVAIVEFSELDPDDPSVWYQVLRRCPTGRFIDVATSRGIDTHGSLI